MVSKSDPARRAMPLQEWPMVDRQAWEAAVAEGDIFDGRGPASHWADATKRTNIQHYGRWLGYLSWSEKLDPNSDPADRITPEGVGAYHQHLFNLGTVAPFTRLAMLVGLKETIRSMTRDRSWRWLQDACNHVQRNAKPAKDKRYRTLPTHEIFNIALAELAGLPANLVMLRERVLYRDLFMLALLATRPLRKSNFTWLKLGQHLVQKKNRWLITIPGNETKNGDPVDYWMPDELVPWFERYLTEIRPCFPGADTTTQLWLSKDGPDLGAQFLYWPIMKLSKRLFSVPINPHLLRDCAASTLALESSDLALTAAPLLGHRHVSTTQKYYVQAQNLEASRRINRILAAVKADLEITK